MFNEEGIAVLIPHGEYMAHFASVSAHDGIYVKGCEVIPIESRHHGTAKGLVLLFQPQILWLVNDAWGVITKGHNGYARTPSVRVAESPLNSDQG